MNTAQIGVFGLGVMGKSLAKNLSNNGFRVAVYNLPLEGEERIVANFAAQNPYANFSPAKDIVEFVQSLERPRKILLMVKSGKPVDAVMDLLEQYLEEGDMLIDGGNSYFKDTQRREKHLATKGVHFIGMGVSGGEKGALEGPSMMSAGNKAASVFLLPIWQKIAAKLEDGASCVDWVGTDGSGHFVKMVHNGIEYADMQILTELYGVLREVFGKDQTAMADYLENWRSGLHDSYLLDISLQILRRKEEGEYLLPQILDVAGHKGTGLWTVKEALELGVAIPTISTAMNVRIISAQKSLRAELSQKLEKPQAAALQSKEILVVLHDGILAARLVALAEGFHLLRTASVEYDWDLQLDKIAQIWRGGCIIRSKMLPEIASIFQVEKGLPHLFAASSFSDLLSSNVSALRQLLAQVTVPTPCLSAALQYCYSMHEAYSTVNLIQAQRDFFGAHRYHKLEGGEVFFHTEWEE